MTYASVRLSTDGRSVILLDQRLLPQKTQYLKFISSDDVADAIRKMIVRGAPAIGVAAGFGLTVEVRRLVETMHEKDAFMDNFNEACEKLLQSRTTAVNLAWVVNRIQTIVKKNCSTHNLESLAELVRREAELIAEEDVRVNQAIATVGNELVASGSRILHLCNTGSLATVDWGTALGVIRMSHLCQKQIHVVCETRPRLQGARLTSWELEQLNIPMTLIVDSAAGYLMQTKQVDLCLVGADRVAANGDTANKIGTYTMACLAKMHNIPFYIVAPLSSIDVQVSNGEQISIEERHADEILRPTHESLIAPEATKVYNPAFDITPAPLISGFITQVGILHPPFTAETLSVLTQKFLSSYSQ
eukprot:jgi/Galph1/5525/GphlegSOOS_G4157.1